MSDDAENMATLISELALERRRQAAPPRRDGWVMPDELYWLVQDATRLQAMKEIAAGLWARSFADNDTEGYQKIAALTRMIDELQRDTEREIRHRYTLPNEHQDTKGRQKTKAR